MNNKKLPLNESVFIRWTVLILISMAMFAIYYFYDVFSGIKSTLQNEINMSNADYGLMYGAYSFTNVFFLMTFFGGLILDKWGIRKTGVVFISFILIGTVLTAYGGSTFFKEGTLGFSFFNSFLTDFSPNLKMLILGRVLFGLGAETINLTIVKICVKWFKSKELALALAINVSFGRVGTALVFVFSPKLITQIPPNVNMAAWFGVMIILISIVFFFFYLLIDSRFDKSLKGQITEDEDEFFSFKDLIALLKNRSFIYITLLCVLFYAAIFPFMGFGADFLHNKFGFSLQESGNICTILPYGTVIFCPLFGWFCDKKGKSASVMIWGSLIIIVCYLIFAFTNVSPYLPLFFLGIAFSLVPAAMWPSVAKIVKESQIGTAYGFMYTVQNFGLMAVPILMGILLDFENKGMSEKVPLNYTYPIIMLAILGALGVIFALLLKNDDKKNGYGLELPNIQ